MATQARLFVAALLLLSATPTTEAITPNLWFDMTVPASSGLTFYTLVASTEGSSMIGQGTSFEKDAPTQAQRANWHFVTKVIGSKLYVSGGSDGATANNNALAAFASDESSDVSKQPRRTNLRTIPSGRFDGILGEYDLSFQQTETSFFPEAVTAVTVDTMTITTGMVSSL
jgi:hypothetical protein